MYIALAVFGGLVVGFAFGRVKNVSKLSAISAELKKFESSASSEVSNLVARIKAKL